MDSLHAIGFYVSSGVSVIGALGVALMPARGLRGAAMAVAGVGIAGIYASLGAGFAALVALVCYLACAVLVAGQRYRSIEGVIGPFWRQLGAVAAGALLALLGYSAFRGDFAQAKAVSETFGASDVGRLLFAHDAFATEAIAALVLVSLAGAAAVWRARDRAR
jgi:NADH:ubiquinone oxidoreductase subunit 6 (subunit J)